jgi:zinc protease
MRLVPSLIALCLFSFPVSAGIFNAQTMTLENGLEVVVIPNHRAPIVHHMLWYKAGAAQEINGHSGVAHFLEHLLFKGTNHLTRPLEAGEFSKIVKSLGGEDNAFTSYDYTAYYQTIAKEHLNTVMQMEADRMRNAIAPESHVISERDVVMEERSQRTDNNPQARFSEQMQATLFPGHPYGRPIIGWKDEILTMTSTHTNAFYNQWYAPNNAVLIITGDITLENVRQDIQRIYGDLPKGKDMIRHFPSLPTFEGETLITHHDAQVKQPSYFRAYQAPSYHQNKEDALALQILENILDGGATTRLYKKLVVESKKAISISLSYSSDKYDTSSLWISATPSDGTSIDELESAINAVLSDLITHGVTDQEIIESKIRLKNAAIFARDSLSAPAHIIGHALSTGSTLQDVETWDKQIDATTKEQIQSVSKLYLGSNNKYIEGHLLPKEGEE